MKKVKQLFFLMTILAGFSVNAQQPDPPGQVKGSEKPKNEAYLFAHMTHNDYGRLYYSVSLDGLHWDKLNNGKRVFEEYLFTGAQPLINGLIGGCMSMPYAL